MIGDRRLETRMGASRISRMMTTAGLIAGMFSAGVVCADGEITIRGKAIFKGDAAKFDPKPIAAVKGTQCDNGRDIYTSSVLVNKHTSPQTLRNVVIWMAEGPVETRTMPPTEGLTIEMVGCSFQPRITTAFTRQRVRILNGDSIPQTFLTFPIKNKPQGVTIPKKNMPISLVFFDVEEPFEIKSPKYPWMNGWIAVFDHPYYLLTDELGTFEFKNFPPGEYTFKAWHEVFGTKTIKISATSGNDAIVEFVFDGAKDKRKEAKVETSQP